MGSKSKVRIPIKKTHSLSKHGYSSKKGAQARQRALLAAVQEQARERGGLRKGFVYVIKKLSALRTLSKRRNPQASATFERNMHWLQKLREKVAPKMK